MQENMNLEQSIEEILFRLVQDIKLHKIDNDNFVIEADYKLYIEEIVNLLTSHMPSQE